MMSKVGKVILGVTVGAAAVTAILAFGPSLEVILGPALLSGSMAEILNDDPHFYDVFKK